MKCHAGVEFESGKPCPKCNAKLGEVCWPGINADLLEVVQLRKENERLRSDLMAERERCALVAISFGEFPGDRLTKELRVMCGNAIADKIREQAVSPAERESK